MLTLKLKNSSDLNAARREHSGKVFVATQAALEVATGTVLSTSSTLDRKRGHGKTKNSFRGRAYHFSSADAVKMTSSEQYLAS